MIRGPVAVLVIVTVLFASACVAPPSPETAKLASLTVRGAYGRDSSATGVRVMRSIGLTTVTTNPERVSLDALAAEGMKAIVWLGAYNRKTTGPCAFERSDEWVEERVSAVAGHPAIAAYQITDEPDSSVDACPNAIEQMRERADLVTSLDPQTPTYLTISKTGYTYERWTGVVDILGLVIYPVSVRGYDDEMIPKAIAEAERDGVTRYWAVLQDFGTPTWYVVPTSDQLQRQFDQWSDSRMDGYMIYHWRLGGVEHRPDHMRVIADANGVNPLPSEPGRPS